MIERPPVTLVRHGETEWTITRRHTGRTDIPLTEAGRAQAVALGRRLAGPPPFALVLTSPLERAAATCRLAGLGDVAEVRDGLREWDYGDYEGRRTADIRKERPGWLLWNDGVPNGESASDLAGRVDFVIAELQASDGPAVVFAHAHVLRVLAARWLGLAPDFGAHIALEPAAVCELGWQHDVPAILLWNDRSHLEQP